MAAPGDEGVQPASLSEGMPVLGLGTDCPPESPGAALSAAADAQRRLWALAIATVASEQKGAHWHSDWQHPRGRPAQLCLVGSESVELEAGTARPLAASLGPTQGLAGRGGKRA
jgi:hypothetical protein